MPESRDITQAYGEALVEAGKKFPGMVVLDSDIADSCCTEGFGKAFPERTFDLGISEQSLPTFAAGLALSGKIPFYNSFAPFAVFRGFDMIRQSICYNRANVKIVGHCAGQTMGYTGPSHHTLEDVGALRSLPGMTILSPNDAVEVREMVLWMARTEGPAYLRLARSKTNIVHPADYCFEPGTTRCLRTGKDVSVFVTGDLCDLALELHTRMAREGVDLQIVHVPTLKPLPPEQIVSHGELTKAAITLEDHNIIGGLGSAVSEIYAEHIGKPLRRIGIPDTFTESDDCAVLRRAYGISLEAAEDAIRKILRSPMILREKSK